MFVSRETLYHFRCERCNKWWTIADADTNKTDWYCPWCGEHDVKDLHAPDYPAQ